MLIIVKKGGDGKKLLIVAKVITYNHRLSFDFAKNIPIPLRLQSNSLSGLGLS